MAVRREGECGAWADAGCLVLQVEIGEVRLSLHQEIQRQIFCTGPHELHIMDVLIFNKSTLLIFFG